MRDLLSTAAAPADARLAPRRPAVPSQTFPFQLQCQCHVLRPSFQINGEDEILMRFETHQPHDGIGGDFTEIIQYNEDEIRSLLRDTRTNKSFGVTVRTVQQLSL